MEIHHVEEMALRVTRGMHRHDVGVPEVCYSSVSVTATTLPGDIPFEAEREAFVAFGAVRRIRVLRAD